MRKFMLSTLTTSPSFSQAIKAAVIGADSVGALDACILKRVREAGVADPQRCSLAGDLGYGFHKAVNDFVNVVQG